VTGLGDKRKTDYIIHPDLNVLWSHAVLSRVNTKKIVQMKFTLRGMTI